VISFCLSNVENMQKIGTVLDHILVNVWKTSGMAVENIMLKADNSLE
jgi:hypothetical protein